MSRSGHIETEGERELCWCGEKHQWPDASEREPGKFTDLASEAAEQWSDEAKALHEQALLYFRDAARASRRSKIAEGDFD